MFLQSGDVNMEKVPEQKGKGKAFKCPYQQCYLSDKHTHEKFQILFLIVGVLILSNSTEKLALPILLFSAPVFVDTWFFRAECGAVQFFKNFLLIISGLFTFSYFLCASNIVIEQKDSFTFNANNAILGFLSGTPIYKSFVCYCLLFLILSPVLTWIGSASGYVHSISEVSEEAKAAKSA